MRMMVCLSAAVRSTELLPADTAMQGFGIEVDDGRNQACVGTAGMISPDGARVPVLVLPTDEELCIAQQTVEVLERQGVL